MHLVFDISFHGFGHLAQSGPVANEIQRRIPDISLTVRSSMPIESLSSRITFPFKHHPIASDVGIPMLSALEVDRTQTAVAFSEFHAALDSQIEDYAAWLADIKADAVVSNVAYVPVAAAKRLGLPAVAMSSLNWADIFAGVTPPGVERDRIHSDIVRCYQTADLFLLTQPGMFPGFHVSLERLPPICGTAPRQPDALRRLLGAGTAQKLLLVTLGGIPTTIDLGAFPSRHEWIWLVPSHDRPPGRADMHAVDTLDWKFLSILGSCDALITKPGYGLYAEAACSGIPVLSSDRPGWPETPHLVDWMRANSTIRMVPGERLLRGDVADDLDRLLAQPPRPAVPALGAARAAELLIELFQRRDR